MLGPDITPDRPSADERAVAEIEAMFEAVTSGFTDLADELRLDLRGTAFLQLADGLTDKLCELVRGLPASTPAQVRAAEFIIAIQLIDGTRSVAWREQ
jgi:hypothetical protein